jgi:pimeloyl-ACP methyl ester carboxylesterase
MVDVGGHQLHVHCVGTGPPRVVLESPLGGLSAAWDPVQSTLGERVRVCSYDRSGLGWSESGDSTFDVAHALLELRAVIASIETTGPVALVGDGFGAALVARFAREHADETSGLVLINVPAPGDAPPATRSPWLARVGALRAGEWLWARRRAADTTGASRIVRAFGHRPDHLAGAAAEARAWDDVVSSAQGDVPPGLPIRRLDLPSTVSPDAARRIAEAVSSVLAESNGSQNSAK